MKDSEHARLAEPGRLVGRLEAARRRRFVGREEELRLFRDALTLDASSFAVLYVYGPGGIGKSSLMQEFARVARDFGRPIVQLDRLERLSDRDVVGALRDAAGALAEPAGELPAWPSDPVVLIDHAEGLGKREAWLRDTLLPQLPARALIVIASRHPPSSRWCTDLAWGAMTYSRALRNLTPHESQTLLTVHGVPTRHHAELLRCTHGHPMALTLAADVLARRGAEAAFSLHDAPDAVRALLERFVDEVPSPDHHRALQLLTMMWATPESLLAQVLSEVDTKPLFEWLRQLSFVEAGPLGLVPHDLAREVLDADFRWREDPGWAELNEQLTVMLHERLVSSSEAARPRIWADLYFLARHNPTVAPYFDSYTLHTCVAEPARPEHDTAIIAAVRRHEGDPAARIATHWLARQPGAFWVFRDEAGRVFGFMAHIELHETGPDDAAIDPAVASVLSWVERAAPARPGEAVRLLRFWMHHEHYQQPSAALNLTALTCTTRWVTHPRQAWSFVATANPEFLTPHFAAIHFTRMPEADYVVGSCRHGIFGHDWRAEPVRQWFRAKAALINADALTAPPAAVAPLLVLSEPDFAQAVKQALRDFTQPQALQDNPLRRSRVGAGADAEPLRALLREACESLRGHRRDEKLYQVLLRTFIEPAGVQERVAEALDLPFSTYRYQLAQGTERVTRWLWAREIDPRADAKR